MGELQRNAGQIITKEVRRSVPSNELHKYISTLIPWNTLTHTRALSDLYT